MQLVFLVQRITTDDTDEDARFGVFVFFSLPGHLQLSSLIVCTMGQIMKEVDWWNCVWMISVRFLVVGADSRSDFSRVLS